MAGVGCSDFMDTYGDMLPGFLKSDKKEEAPKTYKLKEKEPIRTTEKEDKSTPVPEGSPGEEGTVAKPPSEVVPPKEGEEQPKTDEAVSDEVKPKVEEGVKKEEEKTEKPPEVAKEETPAEKQPKEDEKVTEKEEVKKSTPEKEPVKDIGTPKKYTGEDVAMVSLDGGGGAPKTTGSGLSDEEYEYDPRKKRDPFLPFNIKIEKRVIIPPEEMTPLQKYKLSQLNLKAIIYDPDAETGVAMVEDPTRKGFNIYVGTEIADGRVVKITPEEVHVEVFYEDFYGNVEKRIETLKLKGK
jgi:hypothetical protein